MASLLVRNLKEEALDSLRVMASSQGTRGVETYVRQILESHALPSHQDFLDEIDEIHALVIKEYGGPLKTRSEDIIREDRESLG